MDHTGCHMDHTGRHRLVSCHHTPLQGWYSRVSLDWLRGPHWVSSTLRPRWRLTAKERGEKCQPTVVPRGRRGLGQLPPRVQRACVPEPGVAPRIRVAQVHGSARDDLL
jgi:hypothetical protein